MTPEREAKERERFEVLASSQDWNIERLTVDFVLDEYLRPAMQKLWEGFLIRAEIAAEVEAENVRLNNTLLQVSAFLRNWMPLEKGPMMAQFNKMLNEVDAALLPVREAALAPKGATE